MKKKVKNLKNLFLGLMIAISIYSCSSDDSISEPIELITVTQIDKNLLTNKEWLFSNRSYISSNFNLVEQIKKPCSTNTIEFFDSYYKTLEYFDFKENGDCKSIQNSIDYSIQNNHIQIIIDEETKVTIYTVMTLNEDRLVLLQELNPTDKNTPVGAKYIKKEYFRYKGNN